MQRKPKENEEQKKTSGIPEVFLVARRGIEPLFTE